MSLTKATGELAEESGPPSENWTASFEIIDYRETESERGQVISVHAETDCRIIEKPMEISGLGFGECLSQMGNAEIMNAASVMLSGQEKAETMVILLYTGVLSHERHSICIK